MEANLYQATGMMGAILTAARSGKALSDKPALEPYRGKTRSPDAAGSGSSRHWGYVRDRLHADAAIGVSCATRQERTTTDDRLPGIIGQTQSPRR